MFKMLPAIAITTALIGTALTQYSSAADRTPLAVNTFSNSIFQSFLAHGDGTTPEASLISDSSGSLYGTTYYGGASGYGSVFKLTQIANGYQETILYSFLRHPDGANPAASLIADKSGALYGTAQYGGTSDCGTIFKLTPSGNSYTESVVYGFQCSNDGSNPVSSLIADSAGVFYGVASYGPFGDGVVYKLTPHGTGFSYNVIYTFQGESDERSPLAALIIDASGALYSTAAGDQFVHGTAYKLTPQGGTYTESVLHRFTNADGATPLAPLIADSAGDLFGTTLRGGSYKLGTVFKLTPAGFGSYAETVLHSFTGGADGARPHDGLIEDTTGALYGTALTDGSSNAGTVFKLTPHGSGYDFSVIHSFAGGADGANPIASLMGAGAGVLYGTTTSGGSYRHGTVFRLTPRGNGYRNKILHYFHR
jgi:uncharacterized repeat protein (TIGR03803 family)